jgi:hypothetical protein
MLRILPGRNVGSPVLLKLEAARLGSFRACLVPEEAGGKIWGECTKKRDQCIAEVFINTESATDRLLALSNAGIMIRKTGGRDESHPQSGRQTRERWPN